MHVLAIKVVMLRWFACLISGYHTTSSSFAVPPSRRSVSPLKSTEIQILLNFVQCMCCI